MKYLDIIQKKLEGIPYGESFSMSFLSDNYPDKTIRRVIHQLLAKGEIIHIMRGINKTSIQIHGATAAYQLGIHDKKKTENIFLTSGRNQEIILGNNRIQLLHANSPWFLLLERKAGIAIAGIKYLGRSKVNLDTIRKIHLAIGDEELTAILEIADKLPNLLTKLLSQYSQKDKFN